MFPRQFFRELPVKKAQILKLVTALAFGCSITSAYAQSTTDISVTATVDQSCTITAQPLNFGKYDPTSTTDNAKSSSISLTCVKNSKPTVTLSLGKNTGLNGSERRMSNGTEFLSYEVFKPVATDPAIDQPGTACSTNGAETVVWGADLATGLHPPAATDRTSKDFFLCGVIKAGQDVGTGSYSDVLTAKIEF